MKFFTKRVNTRLDTIIIASLSVLASHGEFLSMALMVLLGSIICLVVSKHHINKMDESIIDKHTNSTTEYLKATYTAGSGIGKTFSKRHFKYMDDTSWEVVKKELLKDSLYLHIHEEYVRVSSFPPSVK